MPRQENQQLLRQQPLPPRMFPCRNPFRARRDTALAVAQHQENYADVPTGTAVTCVRSQVLHLTPNQGNMFSLSLAVRPIWTSRMSSFCELHTATRRQVKRVLTHSRRFIGKTGGEIFHEMMLRHDVKHVCKFCRTPSSRWLSPMTKLRDSRLPRWSYSARLRCHLQLVTFRFHPTETRAGSWTYGRGLCSCFG